MKCVIIGSGGREHALYWRLMNDGSCTECYVIPGNGGIPDHHRIDIAMTEHLKIAEACKERNIDLVIIGPEAPLVDGIVDVFEKQGLRVFGPSGKAAQLEGSKLYAKMIMGKYSIPTAEHHDFTGPVKLRDFVKATSVFPLVIKLDGLAAGKGVIVAQNRDEALAFIADNVKENIPVFVEEYLDGEEASVLGISDGNNIYPFVAAQDHKRVFDNDQGPNTGGMGAYAPAPVVNEALLEKIRVTILQPVVDGMKKEGIPFKGILFAGLMVKGDSVKVIEFNTRFGDPETQVILSLIKGRLVDLFNAAVNGKLSPDMISFDKKHAITVVVASGGYPGAFETGKTITGLDSVSSEIMVYHSGTAKKNGVIVNNGGRVLTVTAVGATLREAAEKVYSEIDKVSFDKSFYRKDIGFRAFARDGKE